MRLTKTLLASLILAPSLAYSSVTIDVPSGIQLLTVNGKDAGYSNFGFDSKDNIVLDNGVNQLVFRISKIVMETGSDKTKFKSQPLVAMFDAKDKDISISVPNIKTLQQGMEFNSKPTFELVSDSKALVGVKKDQLGLTFSLTADMAQEVKDYNQTNAVASLSHYSQSNTKTVDIQLDDDVYQSLKRSFKSASYEERKKFLTWAISNLEE
ncbi:YccT family protein [Vibrio mediterranei]|uniref:YccT family protein n=1 Tax=Vibrio mediterranei TaxID=689 RepID=UPI0040696F1F